jgi:putative PIN family toxin of toxin-antitoxin system
MSVLAVYDCMLFFAQATRPERTRETFQLVDQTRVTLCLSDEVLEEVRDVLTREEYQRQFPALTIEAVGALLKGLTARAVFVQHVPNVYTLERDPKDSKYINLALAAGAGFLVTRDKDLLDLMDHTTATGAEFRRRFPDLRIIAPGDFVREIQSDKQ